MSHKSRLDKLERKTAKRLMYQVIWCTEEEAAALDAQRPPWQPGDGIRYIICLAEDASMFFGCPDLVKHET